MPHALFSHLLRSPTSPSTSMTVFVPELRLLVLLRWPGAASRCMPSCDVRHFLGGELAFFCTFSTRDGRHQEGNVVSHVTLVEDLPLRPSTTLAEHRHACPTRVPFTPVELVTGIAGEVTKERGEIVLIGTEQME